MGDNSIKGVPRGNLLVQMSVLDFRWLYKTRK